MTAEAAEVLGHNFEPGSEASLIVAGNFAKFAGYARSFMGGFARRHTPRVECSDCNTLHKISMGCWLQTGCRFPSASPACSTPGNDAVAVGAIPG
jgi:hypothetical protein